MTAVTFGDLLFTAAGHLEAAEARWQDQAADPQSAVRQLRRVIDVMTRYAVDVTSPDHAGAGDPADPAWWLRAATEIGQALRRASQALGRAAGGPGGQDAAEFPPGLPLADAATALLAARDLLSTHLAGDPDGTRLALTEWGPVITSAAVTKTVTDLVAWWSQQLAPLAGHLAALRPADMRHGAARDIAEAGQWLRHAAASAGPARVADPVSAGDRTLLFAIPPAADSGRERPRPGETPPELCRGITLSAARLQAAARGASGYAATSPVATAGAWRWTATAGAVTSHLSTAMLRSLAARSGPLSLPADGLHSAAAAVAAAQEAWQRLAAAWGLLTTETRFLASPAVTEASDLVVRLGRLACDNPQWTPESSHRAPLRDPDVLAPDAGTAAVVIAAVHHAACAFERVAAADLDAVQPSLPGQAALRPGPGPAGRAAARRGLAHDTAGIRDGAAGQDRAAAGGLPGGRRGCRAGGAGAGSGGARRGRAEPGDGAGPGGLPGPGPGWAGEPAGSTGPGGVRQVGPAARAGGGPAAAAGCHGPADAAPRGGPGLGRPETDRRGRGLHRADGWPGSAGCRPGSRAPGPAGAGTAAAASAGASPVTRGGGGPGVTIS